VSAPFSPSSSSASGILRTMRARGSIVQISEMIMLQTFFLIACFFFFFLPVVDFPCHFFLIPPLLVSHDQCKLCNSLCFCSGFCLIFYNNFFFFSISLFPLGTRLFTFSRPPGLPGLLASCFLCLFSCVIKSASTLGSTDL
jgi:hypothetical protein